MKGRTRQPRVRLDSRAVWDHLTRRNISTERARTPRRTVAELPVRARGRDQVPAGRDTQKAPRGHGRQDIRRPVHRGTLR